MKNATTMGIQFFFLFSFHFVFDYVMWNVEKKNSNAPIFIFANNNNNKKFRFPKQVDFKKISQNILYAAHLLKGHLRYFWTFSILFEYLFKRESPFLQWTIPNKFYSISLTKLFSRLEYFIKKFYLFCHVFCFFFYLSQPFTFQSKYNFNSLICHLNRTNFLKHTSNHQWKATFFLFLFSHFIVSHTSHSKFLTSIERKKWHNTMEYIYRSSEWK